MILLWCFAASQDAALKYVGKLELGVRIELCPKKLN